MRPSPMPDEEMEWRGQECLAWSSQKILPLLLSPIPTPFMLFPSSIYYVSRRRDDRRVPQTIVPIDVEFWQKSLALIHIGLLLDRAETTFSCRLSRVSGPFTFLRLRRWHGSITYLPFTKRKKEWTKTASASEREEEQATSQSLCLVNRKPELKPQTNLLQIMFRFQC